MSDIRSRLLGVLEEHFVVMAKCDEDAWEQWEAAVDDLLSLPGIGIVELPERLPGYTENQKPQWEMAEIVIRAGDHGWVRLNSQALEPWEARAVAARLLAAAAAVQAQEEK